MLSLIEEEGVLQQTKIPNSNPERVFRWSGVTSHENVGIASESTGLR